MKKLLLLFAIPFALFSQPNNPRPIPAPTVTGSNNGLSTVGGLVGLGGGLIRSTTVTTNGFPMIFAGETQFNNPSGSSLSSNGFAFFQRAGQPVGIRHTNNSTGIFDVLGFERGSGAGSDMMIKTLGDGANGISSLIFGTLADNIFTVASNGSVGVSATTPIAKIDLNGVGSSNASVRTNHTSNYTTILSHLNGARSWQIDNIANQFWLFNQGTNAYEFYMNTSGNFGMGVNSSGAKLHVQNTASTAPSVAFFKSLNGGGGYAVRGESVNAGTALGVYGELAVFDGTRWNGVRGNSSSSIAPAITGISTVTDGVSGYFNQRVGIGTAQPNSNFHAEGSQAGTITNITATTALNATHHKLLISNGVANITLTLPDALTCIGREYVISRASGSTGSITISVTGANRVQSLLGTLGATSSIGVHSATGGGLNHRFTAINIGGVGTWVRI